MTFVSCTPCTIVLVNGDTSHLDDNPDLLDKVSENIDGAGLITPVSDYGEYHTMQHCDFCDHVALEATLWEPA